VIPDAVKHIGRLLLWISLTAAVSACSVEQHERERHASPDQKLSAVLMESQGSGAQAPVTDNLYINEQGGAPELNKPIFSASHCEGLSFSWLNDYTLQVRYPSPCSINQFTNRWYKPSEMARGNAVPIEIILIRG
jgi:hypothetical protein